MGQGHAAIGRGGAAKTLATRELLREIRRLRALLASASGRTVTVLSL
jgi:hypothetical protein